MVEPGRLAALVLAGMLLAGCATRPTPPAAGLGQLPARVELSATPFFPQEDHQCGPAALATVLTAAGYPADPKQLETQVYLPAREGSLQAEIVAGARRQGALAMPAPSRLDALLAELAAGRPVLVLQNLGIAAAPRWHYAVVIGYDLARSEVLLRSGITKREVLSLRTFEHTWARSDHWGLLVLAPGQLPLEVSREALETALAQQERFSAPSDMAAWYEKAAQRWPDSLVFTLGLGNVSLAAGRTEEAENAFRAAVAMHPASPVALNNLATVLQLQGRLDHALALAEQAVSLGGEWQPQARATRDAILTAIRQRGSKPATGVH